MAVPGDHRLRGFSEGYVRSTLIVPGDAAMELSLCLWLIVKGVREVPAAPAPATATPGAG